jgi:hypothetical protein
MAVETHTLIDVALREAHDRLACLRAAFAQGIERFGFDPDGLTTHVEHCSGERSCSKLEPESRRLALKTRTLRLRSQRGCAFLALAHEREELRSPFSVFAQLVAPLVGPLEHGSVTGDFDLELQASGTAVPPVKAPELAPSCCEPLGRSVA